MEELRDRERRLTAEVECQRSQLRKVKDTATYAHQSMILGTYEQDLAELREQIRGREVVS